MRKTPIRPDEVAGVAVWVAFQVVLVFRFLQPPKGKVHAVTITANG
jgi:hypothetical protein